MSRAVKYVLINKPNRGRVSMRVSTLRAAVQRLLNDELGHAHHLAPDRARAAAKLGIVADCAESERRRVDDFQCAGHSIGELHLK